MESLSREELIKRCAELEEEVRKRDKIIDSFPVCSTCDEVKKLQEYIISCEQSGIVQVLKQQISDLQAKFFELKRGKCILCNGVGCITDGLSQFSDSYRTCPQCNGSGKNEKG